MVDMMMTILDRSTILWHSHLNMLTDRVFELSIIILYYFSVFINTLE